MNIQIDNKLKTITPNFNIGVLEAGVEILNNDLIDHLISNIENKINSTIDIKEVVTLPLIKEARDAYKQYGKDPSRYRLSVESLYRRLSKGNKLYRINTLVDLGNVVSIKTRRSVAVLDYDKIEGQNIFIRLGTESDEYYGIGRGKLNITNIPLYEDEIGPFGSSTSDTERTMITKNTKRILLFIISYTGNSNLKEQLEETALLYSKYANAKNITMYTVE